MIYHHHQQLFYTQVFYLLSIVKNVIVCQQHFICDGHRGEDCYLNKSLSTEGLNTFEDGQHYTVFMHTSRSQDQEIEYFYFCFKINIDYR